MLGRGSKKAGAVWRSCPPALGPVSRKMAVASIVALGLAGCASSEGFLVPVPSDADAPGTSHVEMVVATTLSFPCQGWMIRRWPASVPRAWWIIALSMPAVGTIAARGRRYRKATLVRDYLFL